MIIVAGAIEVDPAARAAFLASRTDAMRRSRAEQGCLEYTFSADPLDPGRVVLLERWESAEALDAHLAAMRAGQPPADGDVRPIRQSIAVYEVAAVRQLGG